MSIQAEKVRADALVDRYAAQEWDVRRYELLVHRDYCHDYDDVPIGLLALCKMLVTEVVALRTELEAHKNEMPAWMEMSRHGEDDRTSGDES